MLKTLLKTLAALFSLVVALIAALFIFLDPNEFKADIEEQAKIHGQINIKIQGDIGWSLFPLGINLNNIEIQDQDLKPFSRFDQLLLKIETSSLFAMAPKVDTVLLDGLNLKLVKGAEGDANWENLLPEKSNSDIEQKKPNPKTESKNSDQEPSTINFSVNTVSIRNVSLHYNDIPAGQNLKLNNLNILLNNIGLDKEFPVTVNYEIDNAQPKVQLAHKINTNVKISSDFTRLDITQLISKLMITSELLKGKTADIEFGGDIHLNTKTEAINIDEFYLSLSPFKLETSLNITDYSNALKVKGQLEIPAFSAPELVDKLGQTLPEFSDPKALSQVGLSTSINLKNQLLTLKELVLKMDATQWKGSLSSNLDNLASTLILKGNKLVADGYLPASKEGSDEPTSETSTQTQAQTVPLNDNAPLLPLETLRALDLDILFTQQSIKAKDLSADNIKLVFKAKDGLLNLEEASLDAFDGRVNIEASIDARSDVVLWNGKALLENLNALKQIQDKELYGYKVGGRGILNASAGFNSLGNSIASLKKNSKAKAKFEIEDGAITGVNLNELACKGYAELGSKSITKTDWPKDTQFKALRGSVTLDGQLIRSPELTIENIGLRANGHGEVNLAKNELLYLLDITPTKDLGDEACMLREKFEGIAIPIKCEGSLDTPPISLCKPDYSKLGDITTQIAKNEAKRKADKEIDRAVDKYLGEDDKTGLGDALKKGLNKWFK